MKKTIELSGHSGCKVLLCEDDRGESFVRKLSGSREYNHRLELQADKQNGFVDDVVMAPKVLRRGYTEDGLFFFDMEFIRGITLAEYMKTVEISRVRDLVITLITSITARKHQTGAVNTQIIADKIESLSGMLYGRYSKDVDIALQMLKSYSWGDFAISENHGDLTFENIIVKNGQLFFIDFLDSFYDCWILDIGTLLQDAQCMWSYRRQNRTDINTLLRLIVFRDVMVDEVKKICPNLLLDAYYALLLKLLRIYPYTDDEKTLLFLNRQVASTVQFILREKKICEH